MPSLALTSTMQRSHPSARAGAVSFPGSMCVPGAAAENNRGALLVLGYAGPAAEEMRVLAP